MRLTFVHRARISPGSGLAAFNIVYTPVIDDAGAAEKRAPGPSFLSVAYFALADDMDSESGLRIDE